MSTNLERGFDMSRIKDLHQNIRRFLLLWAVISVASPLAISDAAADTVLPPGATWEYTFTDPTGDPTWNTTTGGGWATGAAPFGNCPNGCGFNNDFNFNTFWGADGADGDDLWVRIALDFTGFDVSTALWDLGVDNGFKLYANGTQVGGANAEGYTFRWEYSGNFAASPLNAGLNIIAVALEDHGGLTAFDMQITADPVNPVPVPAALWLFGTALIGLVGFGKRRKEA